MRSAEQPCLPQQPRHPLMSGQAKPRQIGGGNSLTISPIDIAHTDTNLFVLLDVDAQGLKLKSNREVTLTPMLVSDNAADTVRLKSFTIAGRNRYYHGIRNTPPSPIFLRAGEIDKTINYRDDTPWRDWMSTARLVIDTREGGCCNVTEAEGAIPVAQLDFEPKTFAPEYLYISPKAEAVKTRALKASAYIDFPVNKTVIYPDYRRNPAELAKIRATIDSVRSDKDITITSLHIKGYASPEGAYAANARLAEGRTEALRRYVQQLYSFPAGLITTSFEPEDWEGLRSRIAADTTLDHRDELLAIIDDPAYRDNPDGRDWKLRSTYPATGKMLLAEVYPALRHSDYAIDYTIRSYTSPEEIIEVMRTTPQKLSLQELYVAALSQEPGSDLYNEAFEIAVRMYPDDPTANLNAACSAMQRNDLRNAARYLDKAGDTPESRYARAIFTALSGDRQAAATMLKEGDATPQATDAARQLDTLISSDGRHFRLLPANPVGATGRSTANEPNGSNEPNNPH